MYNRSVCLTVGKTLYVTHGDESHSQDQDLDPSLVHSTGMKSLGEFSANDLPYIILYHVQYPWIHFKTVGISEIYEQFHCPLGTLIT